MPSRSRFVLASLLAAPAASLFAQSTWTGAASGEWSNAANWVSTATPPAANPIPASATTATFPDKVTPAGGSEIIAQNFIITTPALSNIRFNFPTGAPAYDISGGDISGFSGWNANLRAGAASSIIRNNFALTATSSPANFNILNDAAASTLTLAGNIAAAGVNPAGLYEFRLRGVGTIALTGTIGGLVRLSKESTNTISLTGAYTYSGGFDFLASSALAGRVRFNDKAAFGTGSIRLASSSAPLEPLVDLVGTNAVPNPVFFNGATGSQVQSAGVLGALAGDTSFTVANAASLTVGMTVFGSGVPINTLVTAINGNVVTINTPLTSNLTTGNYNFSPYSASPGNCTLGLIGAKNFELSGPIALSTLNSNGGAVFPNISVADSGVLTLSGPLLQQGGAASLTKTGTGALVLSGSGSTFTQYISVSGGTLFINNTTGHGTGLSPFITLTNAGSTLAGSGSTAALLDFNTGTEFRPGASGGTSTANFVVDNASAAAVTFDPGSLAVFDINGTTRGTSHDALTTTGRVNYGGALTLNFTAAAPAGETIYNLLDFASMASDCTAVTLTGVYADVGALALAGTGNTGVWSATAADGTTFSFAQSTGDLTVVAPGSPASPYQTWLSTYFTSEQLNNPALEATLWGPLADADSDGHANLLEYALASSPVAADSGLVDLGTAAADAPATGNVLTLSFFRARAELTYIVEGSFNLSTWTTVAENAGTVGAEVTVKDTEPTTTARRFLRLRVVQP